MNNKIIMEANSNINSPLSNSLLNKQNTLITKKNDNFGESSLDQFINNSIYEEIKYQNESKEILNELRAKYLPNSTNRNKYSINSSQNMTYFNNNKNNSNFHFSTYTDYNNYYSKSPNLSTQKIDYYKSQKDIQNSFLDNKESMIVNDSIKINNDTLKNANNNIKNDIKSGNDNIEDKPYLNDYLKKENEKLRKINKNYELLISPLIDYINDINHYFEQNIINYHNINQIIKNKDLNTDYNSLDDIKSFLKYTKNNIFNSYKYKKNIFLPEDKFSRIKEQIYSDKNKINNEIRSYTFNQKKKKTNIDSYKPIIADKNNDNEKNVFRSTEFSNIKRSNTMNQRMPKSFWSQNKRVKLK